MNLAGPGPLLVALRGMPSVGKSVLARGVSRQLGWPVLDKDDIKDIVYGWTEAADTLAYDLLFGLARGHLQQGLSVLCDSPLLHPGLYALASQSADEAGGRLVVLECVLADASEHRRRLQARASSDRVRQWAINDWQAFVEYRDRVLPHANYAIDVPHRIIDLSEPEQAIAEAASWLHIIEFGGDRRHLA